jgi:hypothetical protein
MRNKVPSYLLETEEQVDKIGKPLVSFYSRNKTVQSLLAIPEVKDDIKHLIRSGNKVKVRPGYATDIYDKNDSPIYLPRDQEYVGMEMLSDGMRQVNSERHADYEWLLLPPAAGLVIGLAAGGTYGYWSQIFAGGTYGAVKASEIVNTLIGGGAGLGVGLAIDAVVGGVTAVKDMIEEPAQRVGLAKRVRKEVLNSKVRNKITNDA